MPTQIKREIGSFSRWFRVSFFILFILYFALWLFTIYLSNSQETRNLKPILPVMPQDSEEYERLSESLINGRGFMQYGEVETLRTPGYPSFLALFKYTGQSYFAATLAQVILVFFSGILIRRLGILFHSTRTGEIAAVFFLLSPSVIYLSLIILTDILFLFLLLLGFYLAVSLNQDLDKKKFILKIIFASIIFALAIYVRPMGVFALPIFAAPFLAAKFSFKEKAKSIIVMILVILAVVSPWVIRNYKLVGVADFSSFKAINLAAYATPSFLSSENKTTPDEERANIEKSTGIPQSKWRDLQYSPKVASAAEKIILERPFSYIKYHITASLPFLFSSSIQDTLTTYKSAMHIEGRLESGAINYLIAGDWKLFLSNITKVWWKMGERIIWFLIYIIALFGFWKQRRNSLAWVFVFIPAYLMLLAGPAANARYAIQGLPFILVLFSAGLMYIENKLKSKYV